MNQLLIANLHKHITMYYVSFNMLVKEYLKSVNIWQSYGQNGRFCHMPHTPYTFVLKDAHLATEV